MAYIPYNKDRAILIITFLIEHTFTRMSARKSTKQVPDEQYRAALKASWDVPLDLDNTFPPEIAEWINKKSQELGVPFLYIAYPFLTAAAYTLGVSHVSVSDSYMEPIILYTLVSGRSGTNKSGSLSLVKKLIEGLKMKRKQKCFDSGTLEGLLNTLRENDGSVFAAVDEFSTFLDSLDRGSNGNADRARYLSLWSGSSWSKRTKLDGLEEITEPRYQMTSFYQNYFMISHIANDVHYDGFFSRFLIASPSEVYVTLQKKIGAALADDPIPMEDVFSVMNSCFGDGFQFRLDEEALNLFSQYHDIEVLQYRKDELFEDTKSMIKSKSIGNLLRVSGVQAALRFSLHAVQNTDDQDIIDAMDSIIITKDDMQRALAIVSYSVRCLFALIDATKTKNASTTLKRKLEMPSSVEMDEEFICLHKSKVKKLIDSASNGEIMVATVTKNHIYPQIGQKPTSDDARKFLRGLQLHGLGKLVDAEKKFVFVQQENIVSVEKINFFKRLGIYRN